MSIQSEKCAAFRQLHQRDGAFIIPNPWDVGSAKMLQGLGFEALATTSAAFALTLGCADGEVTLEQKIEHCRTIASATSVPLNADFENGFADDPKTAAANILRAVETGIAGCSIEDFSRESQTLYDFNLSVERVQAAAEALASLGMDFQLTARAENLLRGVNDLDDTIKRLQAYSKAGANVLYAPGINSLDQLRQVTNEIDKPLNVLVPFFQSVSVEEFAAAGATRISLGSALNSACLSPLIAAGREMLQNGSFEWTAGMASPKDVQELLG
jgi:2-methylisocitrate lyase-like PEP mutase family enzyme